MDEVPIGELAAAAAQGDQAAWNTLVRTFLPLVMSIARRHRLSAADAADVNQTVWLRLVEHLDDLRDARAMPKWIATVTRNECLRVLRTTRWTTPFDDTDPGFTEPRPRIPDPDVDEELLRAERHRVLREAFATLGERCRTLLSLLMQDPPVPYADIGARLDMKIGSIGPTRIRCLEQLRGVPALRRFLQEGGGLDGQVALG